MSITTSSWRSAYSCAASSFPLRYCSSLRRLSCPSISANLPLLVLVVLGYNACAVSAPKVTQPRATNVNRSVNKMGQLHLAFLGTPEVRHSGQVVTFRTRKALALLIYLVVKGGMHSREELTALFWPESDEEQSRATLRSTLAYLRKTLGEMSDPQLSHLLI